MDAAQFLAALEGAQVERVAQFLEADFSWARRSFDPAVTPNPPLLVAVRVPGFAGHGEEVPAEEALDLRRAEVVKLLIDCGADPNLRYRGGVRPLHMASRYGLAECIRVLVGAGAGLDVRNSKGETPLYRAANLGHVAAVRELVCLGAEAGIANHKGELPMDRAVKKGRREVVEELERAGG